MLTITLWNESFAPILYQPNKVFYLCRSFLDEFFFVTSQGQLSSMASSSFCRQAFFCKTAFVLRQRIFNF